MIYEEDYDSDCEDVECCKRKSTSGCYDGSVETLWKAFVQLQTGIYFLSVVLVTVLKLWDQALPFCLYDDHIVFVWHLVMIVFLLKAFRFSDSENYLFFTESVDFIRFMTAFSLVLEIESLLHLIINYSDISYYLHHDSDAAWKFTLLVYLGIVRIPILSIFFYLQFCIHDYGKGPIGKPWPILFADVALVQFYFLMIVQEEFALLPAWAATIIVTIYHHSTKALFPSQ